MRRTYRLLTLLVPFACASAASFRAAKAAPPREAPRALAPWLGDVSGAAEGAMAIAVDPAAAGRLDGAELSLRRAPGAGSRGFGALGLGAALPLGPVSLYAGASFWRLPTPLARSGTLGLSVRAAPGLWLGASWQRLQAPNTNASHDVYDVGALFRPIDALSVSLGGDALNAPRWTQGNYTVHRALRVGAAVRPWAGHEGLTLAADVRLAARAQGPLVDARAYLDVVPWRQGVHLVGGWRHDAAGHQVWAGLRLEALGLGLMGAGRAYGAAGAPSRDSFAVAARWQARPRERQLTVPARRIEVDVTGPLLPRAHGWFGRRPITSTLAYRLDALARAPQVEEVLLNVGGLDGAMATVDELRAAIAALRRAGKRVVARLVQADTRAYLVASAADHIELDPLGGLDLRGARLRRHYFADALAAFGVRFEAVGIGAYKSAPDALTQAGPRPQEALQACARVALAYATLQRALCTGRGLSPQAAEAAVQTGLFDAGAALQAGLVDAIAPAVQPALGETAPLVHGAPLAADLPPTPRWGPTPRVAVVPIVGVMVQDGAHPLVPGEPHSDAHQVVAALQRAQRDPWVRGIVVRIDSPGGDVWAAEMVWRAIREAARHRPLVASVGDVAASGGYYAAVAAPKIFLERNAVAGSIGIFQLKPDLSGLLERTHVYAQSWAKGPTPDFDDPFQPWSDEAKAKLHGHLQGLYDAFVARVAAGRQLPAARAASLAEGRVYTGAEALALGLADAEGSLADAVAYLRAEAGLGPDDALTLDVPSEAAGPLGALWPRLTGAASHAGAGQDTDVLGNLFRQARRLQTTPLALWADVLVSPAP